MRDKMSNHWFAALKLSSVIYFLPSVNKCIPRMFSVMLLLVTVLLFQSSVNTLCTVILCIHLFKLLQKTDSSLSDFSYFYFLKSKWNTGKNFQIDHHLVRVWGVSPAESGLFIQ